MSFNIDTHKYSKKRKKKNCFRRKTEKRNLPGIYQGMHEVWLPFVPTSGSIRSILDKYPTPLRKTSYFEAAVSTFSSSKATEDRICPPSHISKRDSSI